MQNIYFILRHGQTIYQTKKKDFIYPWPENPVVKLTKRGENQIKSIAKKLKKEKIDLIFASDFFRTRQTAKIVAKELGLKINFDKRLRDVNMGIYHGRLREEFYQDFPGVSPLRFIKRPPGGESRQDCQKRMVNFLKEIDKKYKDKKILIVSHGGPLWLLEGAVKSLNNEQLLEQKHIEVGELRKLCP